MTVIIFRVLQPASRRFLRNRRVARPTQPFAGMPTAPAPLVRLLQHVGLTQIRCGSFFFSEACQYDEQRGSEEHVEQ